MIDVSSVRDGIKTRLATITGLRAYDTMPGSMNVPAAVVWLKPPLEYHTDMGPTTMRGIFGVTVFVSKATDRSAQDQLDGYIDGSGSTSVRAAIEGDRTLDGSASTSQVTELVDYGVVDVAGVAYLAAEFEVEVFG